MVFIKVLGALDLAAAASLVLVHYGIASTKICTALGAYLILKGIVFSEWLVSWIDIIIGAYLLLSLLYSHWLVTFVLAFYLGQKALFSLIN
jgi:hypothetical protein